VTSHNLANLGNLAKIGQLKHEPPAQAELDGLLKSGRRRPKDAGNASNAIESRFDLAYNAAHALALAALRWHGYRSEKTGIWYSRFYLIRWESPTRNGASLLCATTAATRRNTRARWRWTSASSRS